MTSANRIQIRAPYKIWFIFIVTERTLKVARLLSLRALRRRFYAPHVAQQLAYSKTWLEQIGRPIWRNPSVTWCSMRNVLHYRCACLQRWSGRLHERRMSRYNLRSRGPIYSKRFARTGHCNSLRQLRSRSRTLPVCVDIDRSLIDGVH